MLWLTSKWREDNESAQDDDIESKDFEGESGKGGFAESNAEIQTFFFFKFRGSFLHFNIENFAHLLG